MKRIGLMIIAVMLLPMKVYADSIILSCPDNAFENASFVCELLGTTNAGVYTVSAIITLSDGLTMTAFVPKSDWLGDGSGGKIDLYTDILQQNTFSIGSIKLKNTTKNDMTISVDSVIYSDTNSDELSVAGTSKTIKIKVNNPPAPRDIKPSKIEPPKDSEPTSKRVDTNNIVSSADLVDIEIAGYSLDFLKEITDYTLKIKNESSLTITPVLEDSEATYEIIGNSKLKNGSVISVKVTALDNTTKTYKITIEKDEEPKNDRLYHNIMIAVIAALILLNIVRIIIAEKKKIGGATNG